MAEWRALADPATESAVAHVKLGWWGEELGRLSQGAAVHPITRYLAGLPGAAGADPAPLRDSLEAAAAQVGGAPVERAAELQRHAVALHGAPLLFAASLSGSAADPVRLQRCISALATAQYLARAIADYRRDARAGRIAFAVDELLAAAIDNDDLLSSPCQSSAECRGRRGLADTSFAGCHHNDLAHRVPSN